MVKVEASQIISALCTALANEFTEPIYKEPIDQDFERPSFFVFHYSTEIKPRLWPRFQITHGIDVAYYAPERQTQNTDMLSIVDRMIAATQSITLKDEQKARNPISPTSFHYTIKGSVIILSLRFVFASFANKPQTEAMKGLDAQGHFKE